jgi:hypothetical protein
MMDGLDETHGLYNSPSTICKCTARSTSAGCKSQLKVTLKEEEIAVRLFGSVST